METEAEVVVAAERAGIPQLDFATFPHQIFWLAIFLIAIFIVVRRIALPRIGEIHSQRERRIRTDLDEAHRVNEQSKEIEDQIEASLAEAKRYSETKAAESRVEIQKIKARASEEADKIIQSESQVAAERIEALKSQSLDAIKTIAVATASEIVSAIIPNRGNTDQINQVVNDQLKGESSE
ncbi:MAG: hypothetical protein OXC02_08485 [Rhodobacteraceae bacterium]|nr:hypothetical protein [Paracoccaceae bacterium]